MIGLHWSYQSNDIYKKINKTDFSPINTGAFCESVYFSTRKIKRKSHFFNKNKKGFHWKAEKKLHHILFYSFCTPFGLNSKPATNMFFFFRKLNSIAILNLWYRKKNISTLRMKFAFLKASVIVFYPTEVIIWWLIKFYRSQ